jgi:NAD(P)-dependent dehydrogenase (short-subunit alcohol dehydrogenase family)
MWTSEFKGRKIRTNVLSPGAADMPMFDEQLPSKEGAVEPRKQITAMTPLARLARPEEIASAALSVVFSSPWAGHAVLECPVSCERSHEYSVSKLKFTE